MKVPMAVAVVVLALVLGGCADEPENGTIVVTFTNDVGHTVDGQFTYQNQPDQQPSTWIPASGTAEVTTAAGIYNTAAFHYTATATTPTEAYCAGPSTVSVKGGEQVALSFVCSKSGGEPGLRPH